ncbi:MAG: MFS transporter [Thermomicrobiales bacterium]
MLTSLWRHPSFPRLWAAETISQTGSQVTLLALPLAAAKTLDASPFEMGMLAAAGSMPSLLIGLIAGAWVDRLPRRPILIATDLGRAALVLLVPAAWVVDLLHLWLLYAVAFLSGTLTVFSVAAFGAILPSLVARARLVEANGKVQAGVSGAEIAGPGVAGVLVGWLAAPLALVLDTVSFLASALLVGRIPAFESAAKPGGLDRSRSSLRSEVAEGVRVVIHHPVLRVLIGCPAGWLFSWNLIMAVFVLFATRGLGLGAGQLGLVVAAGGAGALAGALLVGRITAGLGLGRTLVALPLVAASGTIAFPLANGSPLAAGSLLAAGMFLFSFGQMNFGVNASTLRQTLVPDRMVGRVLGTYQFLSWGMRPVGALAGGAIAQALGLRVALAVGVGGLFVVVAVLARSPLRSLRAHPMAGQDAMANADAPASGAELVGTRPG